MSTYETDANESIEPRTERALTEYMSVLPEGGDVYTAVGQNGTTYRVDRLEGRCTCPDHAYRNIRCKHLRRVTFATGEETVPLGVDGVDPQLGEHTDSGPRVVASDGGIIEAGDTRPADCDCAPCLDELPCWPCSRDGFDEPADIGAGG